MICEQGVSHTCKVVIELLRSVDSRGTKRRALVGVGSRNDGNLDELALVELDTPPLAEKVPINCRPEGIRWISRRGVEDSVQGLEWDFTETLQCITGSSTSSLGDNIIILRLVGRCIPGASGDRPAGLHNSSSEEAVIAAAVGDELVAH